MNRRNFLTRSILGAAAVAVASQVEAKAEKVTTITTSAEQNYYTADEDGRWTRRTIAPSKVWYKNGIFYQLTTNEQGKWRIAAKSSNGSTWAPTT